MLNDSLNKAFGTADRMASIMRTKAASIPSALSGAVASSGLDYQTSIGNATEQYKHNRGWVFACVRLVAQRIAGQVIHVARAKSEPIKDKLITKAVRQTLPLRMKGIADNLEPLDSHSILDLLADPWELGVAWGMIFSTVASLELTGRSLWYISEENGRKTIFPIPTSWIDPTTPKDRSVWKVRPPNSAQAIPLPGDQIVYFYLPDPADPWGALSTLQALAGAVNADEAIGQVHWRTFSQGQFPGLILTAGRLDPPPGMGMTGQGPRPVLTDAQRQQLTAAILAHYQGVHKYHNPLILDGMIESVTRLDLTPNELDFLNSAKLTKEKICQGFSCNPILFGAMEGANRASAVAATEIFYDNKVNPLIELLSQTLTEFLGPMFSASGEKLVIWIEPAKAHDAELNSRNWSTALARGAVTKNEYRRNILNLPDVPGGDELPAPPAKPQPAE